jgi:hypothetical protein
LVGHEERHEHARDRRSGEQPAERLDPEEVAHYDRCDHGGDSRQDHLA